MPCLSLRGGGLVKTVKFGKATYIGDPINAIRIFNEKMVDELLLVDIDATVKGQQPAFEMIEDVAGECFMPLTYGGGISRIDEVERLFTIGIEKISLNTASFETPELVGEAARVFGSQAVIVSLDVKKTLRGHSVFTRSGSKKVALGVIEAAQRAVDLGAGEILINSIDRDGTMKGYDLPLVRAVCGAVPIPVTVVGGAGTVDDLGSAIAAGASGVAAGSIFVYHGKHRGVMINFPTPEVLERLLEGCLSDDGVGTGQSSK